MKRAAPTRCASKERTGRRKTTNFLNTETAVNQRDSLGKRTSISIPKNPPGDLHEPWPMLFRSAEERRPVLSFWISQKVDEEGMVLPRMPAASPAPAQG